MPRLNIEQRWWTDNRREIFAGLIGDPITADGMAIRFWRAAQDYFDNGIPLPVFNKMRGSKEFLEAGLAYVDGDFVWPRGSKESTNWLRVAKSSGRSGGLASAQAKRNIIDKSAKGFQGNPRESNLLSLSLKEELGAIAPKRKRRTREEFLKLKDRVSEIVKQYPVPFPESVVLEFIKIPRSETTLAEFKTAVESYAARNRGQAERFIMSPRKFIHGTTWRDYLTTNKPRRRFL